jgi:hypothetical protein
MKNLALLLSGLVAGVLAATLLVPRVLADAGHPAPVLQKWQQLCEPASSIAEASSMAGARGNEGWELVGFFGGALCFKRPAPQVMSTSFPAPAPAPAVPAPAAAHQGNASWPGY